MNFHTGVLRNQLNTFDTYIGRDTQDKFQISGEFGCVLKTPARIKSPAPWEDLGADRRPRPKFLPICFRKEGVDRGGILTGLKKKCIVIPFKTGEQFSGLHRGM